MICCKAEEYDWCKDEPAGVYASIGSMTYYCVFHAPQGNKRVSLEKFNALIFTAIDSAKENEEICNLSGTIFDGNISFNQYGEENPLPRISFLDAKLNGEANFRCVHFADLADFRNAHFNGKADFGKSQFRKEVLFEDVNFDQKTVFIDTQFLEDANFGKARFNGYSVFTDAKFSGWAYFSKVQFIREAVFIDAIFSSDVIFENAKFNEETSFGSTHFRECVNFNSAKFKDNVLFNDAKFDKKVEFDYAQFSKKVFLQNSQFAEEAYFRKTIFEELANFNHAHFRKNADFYNAKFGGDTYFNSISFGETAFFSHATFSGETSFVGKLFNGEANFVKACFNGKTLFSALFHDCAYFREARFNGETNFGGTTFSKVADFRGARFSNEFNFRGLTFFNIAILRGLDINNTICLENVDLSKASFLDTDLRKIDFINCTWNKKGRRKALYDEICLTEKNHKMSSNKKDCVKVATLYRRLKQKYKDEHDETEVSDWHFGEREVQRKGKLFNNKFMLILSTLYWLSSGYGERAGKAAWILLFLIALLSLSFGLSGLASVDEAGIHGITCIKGWAGLWNRNILWMLPVNTFQYAIFKAPYFKPATIFGEYLKLLTQIVVPVQIALFALAVRNRFRR